MEFDMETIEKTREELVADILRLKAEAEIKDARLADLSDRIDELEEKIDELEDSAQDAEDRADDAEEEVLELLSPSARRPPPHFRLPDERAAKTHAFKVGAGQLGKGYLITGFYPGTSEVGEIFIKMAKPTEKGYMNISGDHESVIARLQQDISDLHAFVSGILDQLAISVSIGLQRGIPLEVYANKYKAVRFPPDGITANTEIPFASSILDYIFRYLGMNYIDTEEWKQQRR